MYVCVCMHVCMGGGVACIHVCVCVCVCLCACVSVCRELGGKVTRDES